MPGGMAPIVKSAVDSVAVQGPFRVRGFRCVAGATGGTTTILDEAGNLVWFGPGIANSVCPSQKKANK